MSSLRLKFTPPEGSERGWFQSPYTRALAEAARKQQVEALQKLLSACRVSEDAQVTRELMRYEYFDELARLAEGKREQ